MKLLPRNAEFKALVAMRNAISLKALGCRFERGLVGGVSVQVGGHALGAWWYQDGRYLFARVAFQKPEYSAQSAEEAIEMTASIVASHAMRVRF